jgi:hypothetical protein
MTRKEGRRSAKLFIENLHTCWFDLMQLGLIRYTELKEMRINDVYKVWRIAFARKLIDTQ